MQLEVATVTSGAEFASRESLEGPAWNSSIALASSAMSSVGLR